MSRHVTQMSLEDAEHYTDEERKEILASYLPHEREARARGIPQLGSGRVFPISEELIKETAFERPPHWTEIGGMDFGWDHPFAAIKMAWDRDSDIVHIVQTYRIRNETPVIHAAHLRPWGEKLPWSWPHDGLQHDKGSGDQLAEQYRKQGLCMLPEKATHDAGGFGLEAGIMDLLERMQSGRFKVAAHLEDWWQEFRLYHRKDGRIVKERDDLMSATRIALMMLRYSEPHAARAWDQPKSGWIV
jgi:terminase large subunit-like protein